MARKYYWLKLQEDFFRNRYIKKLRRIAGGDTYVIIYLKMLLASLKSGGNLVYEGLEDSFEEEMALELDENANDVKVTVAFMLTNGLIEEVEPCNYVLPETVKNTGSESKSAERVRRFREKKQETELLQSNGSALQCNTNVTECNDNALQSNTNVTECNDSALQSNESVTNVLQSNGGALHCNVEKEKEIEIEKRRETNRLTDREEKRLDEKEQDLVELLKGLFVGWSDIDDFKILYLANLVADRLPTGVYHDMDLRVYDVLENMTLRARAEGVNYIYGWLKKMIPLEII